MGIQAKQIMADGLWRNNPGLCQLLGLCPLLAVTTTFANGLALGIATLCVLTASNALVAAIRNGIHPAVRLPVFVLIIASLVTTVDLLMHAFFYDMHRSLGLFVPLIVTNCAILGRAESFASRHPIHLSVLDGLATGTGFGLVLVTLGGFREVIGQGTLFSDIDGMLGTGGKSLTLDLPFDGLLLALLPPGAFLCFGFLLAAVNLINSRRGSTAPVTSPAPAAEHATR
ncbi:MAG: electron transport complex subunit E [Gammaproteobacteria bacterium]|nr:electron transport complex subunit E [Gammaproteobacteria bacterium]